MKRKKRRGRNYQLTGSVEVCNITRGRRNTTLLHLGTRVQVEIVEISGSIVEKSSIYSRNVKEEVPKEIFGSGSSS
tara:strand:+ start:759 stop:986 length:228 start_codon:yes stop_codon:yes gene_type:complete